MDAPQDGAEICYIDLNRNLVRQSDATVLRRATQEEIESVVEKNVLEVRDCTVVQLRANLRTGYWTQRMLWFLDSYEGVADDRPLTLLSAVLVLLWS